MSAMAANGVPALVYCPAGQGATLQDLVKAAAKTMTPGGIAVVQYLEFLMDSKGPDWRPGFELRARPMLLSDFGRLLEIGK